MAKTANAKQAHDQAAVMSGLRPAVVLEGDFADRGGVVVDRWTEKRDREPTDDNDTLREDYPYVTVRLPDSDNARGFIETSLPEEHVTYTK